MTIVVGDVALLTVAVTLTLASVPILVYPVVAWATTRLLGSKPVTPGFYRPTVDLVVVTTASKELVRDKLANTAALTYPRERFGTILSIDGSLEGLRDVVTGFDGPVDLVESGQRVGKNIALNQGVHRSGAEILVFSDVDARLEADAIERLCEYFADPQIGGVCGQRVIEETVPGLVEPQRSYVRFDSWVKRSESSRGSMTSNDGKLYAMRRQLFSELPETATDDLYNCLSVVLQGRRFVFAPEIHVRIPKPSRSFAHEIERRRRIVSSSLAGIFARPAVLTTRGLRAYGMRLATNKVLRRLIPFFLVISFGASLWGANHHSGLGLLAAAHASVLGLAVLGLSVGRLLPRDRSWTRLLSTPAYFLVGSIGTALGLVDLLRGKSAVTWEPRKSG